MPGATAPETAAEAFADYLGSFDPEDGEEFDRFFETLPAYFEQAGSALAALADRLAGDKPVEGGTTGQLADLAAALSGLADVAHDVHATQRAEHEREHARREDPRPGEQMWNV